MITGDCPGSYPADVVHRTAFVRGGGGADVGSLQERRHCFRGWALDGECNAVGFGQLAVDIPRSDPIVVTIRETVTYLPVDPICSGDLDAGPNDGGPRQDALVMPGFFQLRSPHRGLVVNKPAPGDTGDTLPPLRFTGPTDAIYEITTTVDLDNAGMGVVQTSLASELTVQDGVISVPIPREVTDALAFMAPRQLGPRELRHLVHHRSQRLRLGRGLHRRETADRCRPGQPGRHGDRVEIRLVSADHT